jgi:hypothetical protein
MAKERLINESRTCVFDSADSGINTRSFTFTHVLTPMIICFPKDFFPRIPTGPSFMRCPPTYSVEAAKYSEMFFSPPFAAQILHDSGSS